MASYGSSNSFVAGRYNVWVPGVGQNAFRSYDTATEAQQDLRAGQTGILLDPTGKVDPALQQWSGWTTYQSQLPAMSQAAPIAMPAPGTSQSASAAVPVVATPKPMSAPVPGQPFVFIPTGYESYAGLPAGPYPGAFLQFATEKEADAFAFARSVGVVVTASGAAATKQPWSQAGSYETTVEDFRMQDAPAAGRFNLWFPQVWANTFASSREHGKGSGGAYLSFDTFADAAAAVRRRTCGAVLTPQGVLAAEQPWSQLATVFAQIPGMERRFQQVPSEGKFNLWVPGPAVASVGIRNATDYPLGAYVPFDTAADALPLTKVLGQALLLNPSGQLDLTNPSPSATELVPQLLNSKLAAEPVKGKASVWLPNSMLLQAGYNDPARFPNGAYLAFDSEAEAQAHAAARGIGVVYGFSGALSVAQPWKEAPKYDARRLNGQLSAQRPAGQYSVWFPGPVVLELGVSDVRPFVRAGAYMGFATVAEAQAHAAARNVGVVLDPTGTPVANQGWIMAASFAAQLLNPQLTAAPTGGKFNVWFPALWVSLLGPALDAAHFPAGAYLAFDTEADAQAHVAARGLGVVVDGAGRATAKQRWNKAQAMIAQLANATATAQPTAGQYNVWVPTSYLSTAGLLSPSAFPRGAFFPFATAAEAQAHVQARGFGVILDANGAVDPAQPWFEGAALIPQLLNDRLSATRPAGKFSVWFPPERLSSVGVISPSPFTEDGAYIAFSTEEEAAAHARARNLGLVLDPSGAPAVTQPWQEARRFGAQLLNSNLADQPTSGQFNVWFPVDTLANIGVPSASKFPDGAYLAFATQAEAEAHEADREVGVLLDAAGAVLPNQPWKDAGVHVARRENPKLTLQRPVGKCSVWFPASQASAIGLRDGVRHPGGTYLAFDTRSQALDHIRLRRNLGVLVTDRGVVDTTQLWPEALREAAMNPDLKPPPPSGWVSGPTAVDPATVSRLGQPTSGSVALGPITGTKTGADVVVYVGTTRPPDAFHFFVAGQVNGNWLSIHNVPDLVGVTAPGWSQFTLHVDYDPIDAYLKGVNPGLGFGANTTSAIGVRFISGHDSGIPGWSENDGTDRDALWSLPAKATDQR